MIPVNRVVAEIPARLDPESAEWLRVLGGAGPRREAALARLHGMLLRIAQREARRRGPRMLIAGPELEDLAYQAAADALMAITAKLSQFRGESRFTTWAYRFVILEVSAKLGRHFWRRPDVRLEAEDWDRLPVRFRARAGIRVAGPAGRAAPCRGHRADCAAARGVRRDRGERCSAGRAGRQA